MRILLVEDSSKLQRAVGLALRKAGYVVDVTGDGEEGFWLATENRYDVLVLDLMLPGLDGMEILRRLRKQGCQTPVLILTVKSSVEDRVTGLRAGADDYLTKPFSLEELVARVESLIRRGYGERSPVVRLGNLELNTTSRTLARDGEPVSLTPREYRLLELLALRRGEVLSRADIEEHLYGEEMEVFSNVVESTISSLRKKIDPSGSEPLIQTRRGMGYVLEA
ncbi:MAG TPA: response regulator transcription factor [Methylomirabilota bacterium]|nr:response regulator transcription factor [Methylomirabilota bacterium]